MSCNCYIVPPYLLESMSKSPDESLRKLAEKSIAQRKKLDEDRVAVFASLATIPAQKAAPKPKKAPGKFGAQGIVPDDILEAVSKQTGESAQKTLAISHSIRAARESHVGIVQQAAEGADTGTVAFRIIHDMKKSFDEKSLPGGAVRREGQGPAADKVVNQVYDNLGYTLRFFKDQFDWDSIDDRYMPLVSTVHFGEGFANAFWSPALQQFVYGDGDGKFLYNFAGCLDVIAHEFTHAVTEHTSALVYERESGALNEHVSDVFGIMVKQKFQNETAKTADWLIGEDCIFPGVKGVALRSMKAPGTAFSDNKLNLHDRQPDHYSKVDKKLPLEVDNGGVHIYSGIPNKAFYNAAIAFDGYSWEKAGVIWWKAMTSGRVPPLCNFIQFADVTVDLAFDLYGESGAKIVRKAWNDVGVTRKF